MDLLRAAFYRPEIVDQNLPVLPVSSLSKEINIGSTHCERYNRAVGWKLGIASVIHPNYLQVLTLPMQLEMMISQPFPFKPMGLVHLANHIDINFLPEQSAKLTLKTSFSGLTWHKKGWVFAVLSEGSVGGKLAISGTSFYLSRQRHVNGIDEAPSDAVIKTPSLPVIDNIEAPFERISEVNFALGVGRKYARVSGDFNPIHLTRWTAKMMGFKQAIAHGMYSKALCVSDVVKQEAQSAKGLLADTPMQFSTQFMQPIYLPTPCELMIKREANQIDFSLRSKSRAKHREHLRTKAIIG